MKKKKEGEKGRGVLLSCENQNKQTKKQTKPKSNNKTATTTHKRAL